MAFNVLTVTSEIHVLRKFPKVEKESALKSQKFVLD